MIDFSRTIRTAAALAAAWFALFSPARAQLSEADLVVRIERLENQIRQLTGTIEQLQYRNQQLEEQLRHTQPVDARAAPPAAAPRPMPPAASGAPPPPVATAPPIEAAPVAPGRRGDAFDPSQNPNAPGAPRALGSYASTAPPGVPEPRPAGAPLDLSAPAGQSSESAYAAAPPYGSPAPAAPPAAGALPPPSGALPPPPPRNPNGTGGALATLPPSATPRDEFDLAHGYVLHKDYGLAEQGFRDFLKKYPGDPRAADANYWLGETLFQRQKYRDAAELFLLVSRDHPTTAKAPDSLLRLGQSLAQMGEKDAACGTLAEVGRKYPRAALTVRQAVEREQKRVHC
ncbi:MAG: tol-pal system protein YbgF [Hyphomicrobiales bacterium]|nr:tol-pal system protein YbgF [Hyphomicrobiales bacterium]MBV8824298.1 tol-pal system protein YbgF [Hyphomicrobiales bacterium]MBV9427225.1 tol-pal system protein YbgF [Bradyrhizobiaceae bacterium]